MQQQRWLERDYGHTPTLATYEAWVRYHGGANHDGSGLDAARACAEALTADYSERLGGDTIRELGDAIRRGLFQHGTPEARALLGVELGLWAGWEEKTE